MEGRLLFLGTGSSGGVPMVGCTCSTCRSPDEKNKRLRPAALIHLANQTLLIDAGPDFRAQALRYGIHRLDGLLLTHTHFDHVAGLDELRAYYLLHRLIVPVLASKETLKALKKRYDYLFCEKYAGVSLTAQLDFHVLEHDHGMTQFCSLPIEYVTYEQGGCPVNGFRFGSLAYLTDVKQFSENIFHHLQGVETLVVNALREEPSYMHLSLHEAVAFAQKIGAKQTYFTHISHELEHQAINARLPQGFALAYDGLEIPFSFHTLT